MGELDESMASEQVRVEASDKAYKDEAEPPDEEVEFERLWKDPVRQRVFVDCGFHNGEGLSEFQTKIGIDDKWVIHAFEIQDVNMEHIPEWLQRHPHFTLHNAAAWVEPCTLQFRVADDTKCSTLVASGHSFAKYDHHF